MLPKTNNWVFEPWIFSCLFTCVVQYASRAISLTIEVYLQNYNVGENALK